MYSNQESSHTKRLIEYMIRSLDDYKLGDKRIILENAIKKRLNESIASYDHDIEQIKIRLENKDTMKTMRGLNKV